MEHVDLTPGPDGFVWYLCPQSPSLTVQWGSGAFQAVNGVLKIPADQAQEFERFRQSRADVQSQISRPNMKAAEEAVRQHQAAMRARKAAIAGPVTTGNQAVDALRRAEDINRPLETSQASRESRVGFLNARDGERAFVMEQQPVDMKRPTLDQAAHEGRGLPPPPQAPFGDFESVPSVVATTGRPTDNKPLEVHTVNVTPPRPSPSPLPGSPTATPTVAERLRMRAAEAELHPSVNHSSSEL